MVSTVGWQTKTPNVHMAEESSGAWLEVFMASMARDCVAKAKEQVGRTTKGRPDHGLYNISHLSLPIACLRIARQTGRTRMSLMLAVVVLVWVCG